MAMSPFKPGRFGTALINSVMGIFQIEGATVIASSGTVREPGHVIDTDTSITFLDTDRQGAITLSLPAFDDVPVGWRMTFKDIGPFSGGDSVRLRGTTAEQKIDGATSITLNARWEAVTLQNTGIEDGDTWLIVDYFNGLPPS